MARDAVTLVQLVENGSVASGAGTAIAPANGAVVAAKGLAGEHLILRVINTFAGAKNLTIKAGVKPPALRADLGDLVIAMAQNDDLLIKVESARFAQANGDIWLDFEAAMTGTVRAYRVRKAGVS